MQLLAYERHALIILIMLMLAGCTLAPLEPREPSKALNAEQSQNTAIGRALAPMLAWQHQASGFYPLTEAVDAFAARMLLAHAAEQSLDVQYYIWRGDITGTLLLEALYQAAERGVRVRLLLDDLGVNGLDAWLSALDSHANIEVRLFNPFVVRRPKALGFITDFARANRRMHNKSFTADNSLTIVGGRNVGDEYFGATDGVLFADLDVLAAGPVVAQTSEHFDQYWASASAYPVEKILTQKRPPSLAELDSTAKRLEKDRAALKYIDALHKRPLIAQMLNNELELYWAKAELVTDDPAKGIGQAAPEGLIIEQLLAAIGQTKRQLDLVSPYFVPTKAGVKAFAAMAKQGIRVRILTNALEATDVTLVHSGYAKYRKALLEAGVELYEMRRTQDAQKPKEKAGLLGSQGSSLHAKTFAVDGKRVFVGSFNFDPRSANLNTELGFLLYNQALAQKVHTLFDQGLKGTAYQVKLDEQGALYWQAQEAGQTLRLSYEPGTGWLKRTSVKFLALLPIDWLL